MASPSIQRCQQGVRKEALSEELPLSLGVGGAADLYKWWEGGVILTFNKISEIWVFHLTSGLERATLGRLFSCCWLAGSKGLPVLLPSQGSISKLFNFVHSSRGESRQGSPLKREGDSWWLAPAVLSLCPLIRWLFSYVQWTLARQLKKQTLPENRMAVKTDKFSFACNSRHSESCSNVTLEPRLR